MKKREIKEVITDIRKDIPGFNKEKLLKYTKWAIESLYNSLKNEKDIEIKCTPELVNKLKEQKDKYRINKNIDKIITQYIELFEVKRENNELYVQIYASIRFYDDADNNENYKNENDKFWNDIWIITSKEIGEVKENNSNCNNCGALMEYNLRRDMFECRYCGNVVYNNTNSEWEIVDIEAVQ